jgi:hypothetical protein
MSTQKAKTTLLIVAAAAVTLLSVYLGYRRLSGSEPTASSGSPSTPDPADSADSSSDDPGAAGSRGPRLSGLRRKVHGVTGDLAGAPRRTMVEGRQVVARYRLGKAGRSLPGFGSASDAHPTTEETAR